MTSVKIKFRESTVEKAEGVIYYQLIKNQKVRQVNSGCKIFSNEWDYRLSQIALPFISSPRRSYIETIKRRVDIDSSRLFKIIEKLEQQNPEYNIDSVVAIFEQQTSDLSLFNFTHKVIARLMELRRERCAETYKTTLNSFLRFKEGEDILLTDITANLIMDYEVYLKSKGISMNTISFYMRVLRALYNRAVDMEYIEQTYPFKHVYTGVDKTVKRALSTEDLKRIKSLNLSMQPDIAFARDLFLFSFYTRGMSFVDMAYLQKSDLCNGVLKYRRRKTNQMLSIRWESCMQELLNIYPNYNTPYLLPIIVHSNRDPRVQYRSALCLINARLKRIASMLNISTPLTMYCARHSWASVAKSKQIPISVISEGMGHESESTTQIYLSSIDTSIIDQANRIIVNLQ